METLGAGVGAVLAGLALAVLAVFWIVRSPGAYNQFQDVITEMSRDNQEMRAELAANDEMTRQLRRELHRAEGRVSQLEIFAEAQAAHIELLSARLRALGQLDIPPGPQPPQASAPQPRGGGTWSEAEPVAVAKKIATLFDADEIYGLAFELEEAEGMVGDTAAKRARWLVSQARHVGKYEQLKELCRRARPNGGF